jgi:hypothetical protein
MTISESWHHETTLAAEARTPAKVRDFVRQHLVEHECPALFHWAARRASEPATATLLHAQRPLTVALSKSADTVVLAVEDRCSTGPALAAPGRQRGAFNPRLTIVENLSSDWGVATEDPSATTLWASFQAG